MLTKEILKRVRWVAGSTPGNGMVFRPEDIKALLDERKALRAAATIASLHSESQHHARVALDALALGEDEE